MKDIGATVSRLAVVALSGLTIVAPSGLAVVAPSGLAVVAPSGLAVVTVSGPAGAAGFELAVDVESPWRLIWIIGGLTQFR
jgi:hypothetical protein